MFTGPVNSGVLQVYCGRVPSMQASVLLSSDEHDEWMESRARGTGRRVRSGFPDAR